MLSCNASGTHFVKPLVIGTARQPQSFEIRRSEAVSALEHCHYLSQTNSMLTRQIFIDWFHNLFCNDVCNRHPHATRIICFLGPVASQFAVPGILESRNGVVQCYVLPSETIKQPLDFNINVTFKRLYRYYYLLELFGMLNSREDIKPEQMVQYYDIVSVLINVGKASKVCYVL